MMANERGRDGPRGEQAPVTIFGPDFPFPFDDWIAHPAGLGSIPAERHGEEVAVVGVQDSEFGQRLKAFVVRAAGSTVTAEELRDYVHGQLARFKTPREVT